jgi:hypothetical protein
VVIIIEGVSAASRYILSSEQAIISAKYETFCTDSTWTIAVKLKDFLINPRNATTTLFVRVLQQQTTPTPKSSKSRVVCPGTYMNTKRKLPRSQSRRGTAKRYHQARPTQSLPFRLVMSANPCLSPPSVSAKVKQNPDLLSRKHILHEHR